MTELQGAVVVAQLDKLEDVVDRRIALAEELTAALAAIPGITTPQIRPGDVHTYWKYCLRVDCEVIPGGPTALGAALKQQGVFCAPRYIQKPAFECEIFREQRTFGTSRWPFTLARPEALDYRRQRFAGTYEGLDTILVLPWNERYTSEHVRYIAESIAAGVSELRAT